MSARICFMCPTCKAKMDAPVERAGNKINCLKCGQRLQIPAAERAKTILAPGLGVQVDNKQDSCVKQPAVPIAQLAGSQPPLATSELPHAPASPEPGALAPSVARSPSQAFRAFVGWLWNDSRLRWGAVMGLFLSFTLCCGGFGSVVVYKLVMPGVAGKYISDRVPNRYRELNSDGTFFEKTAAGVGVTGKYEIRNDEIRLTLAVGFTVACKFDGKTMIDPDGERWTKRSTDPKIAGKVEIKPDKKPGFAQMAFDIDHAIKDDFDTQLEITIKHQVNQPPFFLELTDPQGKSRRLNSIRESGVRDTATTNIYRGGEYTLTIKSAVTEEVIARKNIHVSGEFNYGRKGVIFEKRQLKK